MSNVIFVGCIALFLFLTSSLAASAPAGRQSDSLAIGYLMVAVVLQELQTRTLFRGGMRTALILRWVSFLMSALLVIGGGTLRVFGA